MPAQEPITEPASAQQARARRQTTTSAYPAPLPAPRRTLRRLLHSRRRGGPLHSVGCETTDIETYMSRAGSPRGLSPQYRFESDHVVGQSGGDFEWQLGVTEVRIRPRLRYTPPQIPTAEEGSGH